MKAKEYAEKYIQAEDKDKCLESILLSFYEESVALIKGRSVKKNSALFSVWDEFDQKWRSFVKKTEDDTINLDGFKFILEKVFLEGYVHWMQYRKNLGK